ncbi:hypothetical protein ACFFJY_19670 [Fictibacillus aquaticus]|uniref:DUF4386 domain-containing protein n=1 Tax=Fictibacillus aquaticus TaxID=2021314 RepID=A0A235F5L1_9BACL|nr:hypothetical protein [Fictibacillus aquaticus]OYD56383.1 hypothetical protein CGZ90_17675 [Fictibacillus aquaticus]
MDKKVDKKPSITGQRFMRVAGVFALLAGILYIGIQFVHPADQLSSVNTSLWVAVACATSLMSLFSLIGLSGIYSRQAEEAGWLGLIGFIFFSLFWLLSMNFSFIEAFVLPLLTTDAPEFVKGIAGLFSGTTSTADLGIFPVLAPIAGILYGFGGLLFGIATYRARVFPRMAGALLAFAAVVTFAAAVIPHPFDRVLAIPMGAALIWLGYTLWAEPKRLRTHDVITARL